MAKENERTYEVSLPESEWDIIIELLTKEETRCKAVSKTTRNSGYGKATTLEKADEWLRRAEQISNLQSKITINAT